MVKMALKSEYKSIFRRTFENLTEIKQYQYEKEEELFNLIDQIAETLFECQEYDTKSPEFQIYQNYIIKNELKKEKEQSLGLMFRVVGTFH